MLLALYEIELRVVKSITTPRHPARPLDCSKHGCTDFIELVLRLSFGFCRLHAVRTEVLD